MSTRRHILAAALALTGLLAANTNAQDKTKDKGMPFHGKVEAVTDKGLTVNGEKIEVWMDGMTMSYAVDKPGSPGHAARQAGQTEIQMKRMRRNPTYNIGTLRMGKSSIGGRI